MEIRQIALRSDTAANWLSVDPVLAESEFGVESDTGRVKIGDGSSAWSALGYQRVDLAVSRDATTLTISASGDDAVLPVATQALAGLLSATDKSKLDGLTSLGDVVSGAANAFTGANRFHNASGQTFGTAAEVEDAIVIAGRAGGSSSYRLTLRPAALSGNRELTAPDRNGALLTDADLNEGTY